MPIYFNKKVYSPEFSSVGTILLADKLIKDGQKENASVLDVGCGSGVIGLGVKFKNPFANVTLCDVDKEAIKVTKRNARDLKLRVTVIKTDLLPKLGQWDIITANLPTYSDEDMKQELNGPPIAYYSKEPLALYEKLFTQARGRCRALVCECQDKYQKEFLKLAQAKGWTIILFTETSFAFI